MIAMTNNSLALVCLVLACGGNDGSTTDAGPCPDEHGAYSIVLAGQGCGDLNASALQCITQSSCAITLTSTSPAGGQALNGTASLDVAGAFTSAAISEGTANRTGCVGTWSAATSTLTVDCGGVGSSQSCRATLARTSMSCP
jgi:hypothetical protein